MFSSRIQAITSSGSFDFMDISREMYQIGKEDLSAEVAYDLDSVISDFRIAVKSYRQKYEEDFNDFIRENSLLEKMKNSLSLSGVKRSQTIGIKNSDIQNSKESTLKFSQTMKYGHSLLLKMREVLTGSKINTKFIVSWNGDLYEVDEENITPELVLSTYSSNTVSNPFSLAYQITDQTPGLMDQLTEQNRITDKMLNGVNLFEEIWSQKEEYLAKLEKENHKNYYAFWNAKDAEIYELLKQEIKADMYTTLSTDRYISLRKSMGGGGGYATPFYKAGDIADTQIKFVSLQNASKMATINFARFSLLRDRFQELDEMLSKNGATTQDILENLRSFFTEKEDLISDSTTKIYNSKMNAEFDKWISLGG